MAQLPEGELRVRRRKQAQAPPRLLMREFPTIAAPKPGSEQSLDNLNSYSDKLVPVKKKRRRRKKTLLSSPAQVSLAGCGFLLLLQSQTDWWHRWEPGREDEAAVTELLGLLLGLVFFPIQPHLVPFGHPSGHDQLDHPALVPLRWHGLAQRLHGVLVGFSQQRLSVDSDQLVVDTKPSVLLQEERRFGCVLTAELWLSPFTVQVGKELLIFLPDIVFRIRSVFLEYLQHGHKYLWDQDQVINVPGTKWSKTVQQ